MFKATHIRGLLLLCGLLPAVLAQGSATTIRGIIPRLRDVYQPGQDGNWACLGGGHVVDFSKVNDDYCDCLDGSDEPGTPACPNGVFYCNNRGHVPQLLNASAVDDGICDCCDGSDESRGRCQNTCIEAGGAARSALKALLLAAEAGTLKRNGFIAQAAKSLSLWRSQLDDLIQEESSLIKTVGLWKLKSQRAAQIEAELAARRPAPVPPAPTAESASEASPEVASLAISSAEELSSGGLPADVAPSAPLEGAGADGANADKRASVGGGPVEPAPHQLPDEGATAAKSSAAEKAASEAATQAQAGQLEDSPEEIGKRIASQWTHDPDAVGSLQADEEEAEGQAAQEVVATHEFEHEEVEEAAEAEESQDLSEEDLSHIDLKPLGAFRDTQVFWLRFCPLSA
eukprot:jgi/Botrbrau1/21097/Bobra.0846s0001.2